MIIGVLLYIYAFFIVNAMIHFVLKNYILEKSRPIWINIWGMENTPRMFPEYATLEEIPSVIEGTIVFVGEYSSLYIYTNGRFKKMNSKHGKQYVDNKPEPTKYLLSDLGVFVDAV